ncbi:type II toxin-antitoxin system HipA family toxin [Rhabdaerophilum sp. SD176]|uniref:type II toxin-antitoxin system HipA family toxin n=1 Tax=Rhabdaerophilum sp. SD176 TaxID=2983548 RepID=UPI0024E00FC2|nr:type II toxin-antitoxin system HipA family toxin [Rhabdaerophilum sp. SD176]
MSRRRANTPLDVYLNNRLVGQLLKDAAGATSFAYDQGWLAFPSAIPVSLSLPLRETPFVGAPVLAVFENLLPDSEPIRRRVAENLGARGTDAYSLLSVIGRDCVGALQFLPEGQQQTPTGIITAEALTEDEIAATINNLARAPLGLDADDDFRISVAGAQEKTALLFHKGQWKKPTGTTPTTHLFKPQIGQLPHGIDLSNSVENEFYCLKLLEQFGLQTNACTIETFGDKKVLVIERFDRRWTKNNLLIRLPQEDTCQALSIPPSVKYQNQGGPSIVGILKLLQASDTPEQDQQDFFKAQILFWLMGATDGHGKNVSIFLTPGGKFRMTPFYDVLTALPSLEAGQIHPKQMNLAMSVGDNKHYRMKEIVGRHFLQSGIAGGMAKPNILACIDQIITQTPKAFDALEAILPKGFPPAIHDAVKANALNALNSLRLHDTE